MFPWVDLQVYFPVQKYTQMQRKGIELKLIKFEHCVNKI